MAFHEAVRQKRGVVRGRLGLHKPKRFPGSVTKGFQKGDAEMSLCRRGSVCSRDLQGATRAIV